MKKKEEKIEEKTITVNANLCDHCHRLPKTIYVNDKGFCCLACQTNSGN